MSIYDLPDLRPFRIIQHRMRLAGGAVVTENGSLESDDFVAGVSGWQINGLGDVEFNDGVFRGTIEADALSITLSENDDGSIELYDSNDLLVGLIAPQTWSIGDLTTPGARVTIDPLGGLRLRSDSDTLVALLDQQGLSLRDETSGQVVSELTHRGLRVISVDGVEDFLMSSVSESSLPQPTYISAVEASPGSSLVVPAATILGTNDIELGHVAAFVKDVSQAATMTPPAGWTEVTDSDEVFTGSTLQTSVARRAVATGTAGTFTSTQSNWEHGIGTHLVLRGTPGGTTPSVRSSSEAALAVTGSAATITLPKPTGTLEDDVLVVFVTMAGDGVGVPTGWVTPEGWVFMGANLRITGTGLSTSSLAVGCWVKKAGASEPSTYETSITFPLGSKLVHGVMLAVDDCTLTPGGPQFTLSGYNIMGDWIPWTPADTNITVGNGTLDGSYMVIGSTCFWQLRFDFGSTSAITGAVAHELPFTPVAAGAGVGTITDASALGIPYQASCYWLAGDPTAFWGSEDTYVNSTVPMTWATGDSAYFSGVFQV